MGGLVILVPMEVIGYINHEDNSYFCLIEDKNYSERFDTVGRGIKQ